MQIDRLKIRNFTGFDFREFTFNPTFNLLVGDNAAGKSSVLDALAVAVGGWFLGIPGYGSGPGIDSTEVRLVAQQHPDGYTFEKQYPSRIECEGVVMGERLHWARGLQHEGGRTTTVDAKPIIRAASEAQRRVQNRQDITLPLICAFGTERLWFEKSHHKVKRSEADPRRLPSRLDGYRDCLNFTIQETDLRSFIRDEESAKPGLNGNETIALRLVKTAITGCIEDAKTIYYNGRYKDAVVVMQDNSAQLLRNLSDGQRIMLTNVADIARRIAMLNPDLGECALKDTPGVVLIDELDLHLHPKWQRRVIHDLKRTFPSLQFIATTHSPQLIGEALPEEIMLLDGGGTTSVPRSFGIDSSRILEEVMGAESRNPDVKRLVTRLFSLIDKEEFDQARSLLSDVEARLGADDPDVTRARALMVFLGSNA